jgi:hypothetical protein
LILLNKKGSQLKKRDSLNYACILLELICLKNSIPSERIESHDGLRVLFKVTIGSIDRE